MSSSAFNVAIVGLGWWGRIITQKLLQRSPSIAIVHLADSNPAAGEQFPSSSTIRFSTRYEDVLEDERVHAVFLVTPHALHEEQVTCAAAAGKHVFCEKPLGLTLESVERSVSACRRAGVVLGIGHERRFETPLQELRDLVKEGVLGTLLQVEANFSHDRFLSLPRSNWRLNQDEAPAAGMTGPGIHLLDLAISFLGEVEKVAANVSNMASDLPIGDTLGLLARHRSGATSYVAATLATPFISRFALFGSRGWVEIRDKAHVEKPEGWWVQKQLGAQPLEREEYRPMDAVVLNFDAFVAAARGRAEYPISTSDLLAAAGTMEAAVQSARNHGMTVSVTRSALQDASGDQRP